jgi:hypothetical protein
LAIAELQCWQFTAVWCEVIGVCPPVDEGNRFQRVAIGLRHGQHGGGPAAGR